MRTIAVVNRKGGSGKTTTVMNLAGVLAGEGFKVLVVDTDTQKSCDVWATQAERNGVELPFDVAADTDLDNLARMRQLDYDIVLIDTPGSLEAQTERLGFIAEQSDFVIIPFEPAPLEIPPTRDMANAVPLAHDVPFRVLVNRIDPQHVKTRDSEAQSVVEDLGLPRFATPIRNYWAHKRAPLTGRVSTQYGGWGSERKARGDYEALGKEVIALLGLTTAAKGSK